MKSENIIKILNERKKSYKDCLKSLGDFGDYEQIQELQTRIDEIEKLTNKFTYDGD